MNKNTYGFKTSKVWSFGKGIVGGMVVGKKGKPGDSNYAQIQEHLETIYAIGYFRIMAYHTFKFIKFNW